MTKVIFVPLVTAAVWSCATGRNTPTSALDADRPIGSAVEIIAPLGVPPLPLRAADNPTAEAIALGSRLFHDTRLSADNTVSCATCHDPERGFADGKAVSKGIGGRTGLRNAPTVLNAAYSQALFWDGRAVQLEEQVAGPLLNPVEMNQPHDLCVAKLASDQTYPSQFAQAFGPGPITIHRVEKAIASFERTLLSGNSAFDKYRFGGDARAMNGAAIRGLAVFEDPQRGNCASCHIIQKKYALFTDGKFHNVGIGVNDDEDFADLGRYSVTKVEADKGAFKTPTLRNVARRIMPRGSLKVERRSMPYYYATASRRAADFDPWRIASKAHRSR